MSATHEQLLWAATGRQAKDPAGDTWTKAQDGLWEFYDPDLGKNTYLTSFQLHHVWSPLELLPVYSQQNPYGHVAYVGEDGQLHDLGAAVVSTDFSWTDAPQPEDTTRVRTNYTTELTFERVGRDTAQQKQLWRHLMAGSPKQELLARVNARLARRDPGKPINWKGL